MIKCGIIGGAGYTAGELIRLLLNHPDAELTFINSSSNAGNKITDVHGGLYGETDLVFTSELPLDSIDLLFFCTAHGDTKKFMESHTVPENVKIIDLSMDYRIEGPGFSAAGDCFDREQAVRVRPAGIEPPPDLQRPAYSEPRLFRYLHPIGRIAVGEALDAEFRLACQCHHGIDGSGREAFFHLSL